MADPSFAEMESEAETSLPSAAYSRQRDDKANAQPHIETDPAETNPLLGPPVLTDPSDKKWHNTASVGHSTGVVDSRCFGCCRRFCWLR
jgi:hypothetical protein